MHKWWLAILLVACISFGQGESLAQTNTVTSTSSTVSGTTTVDRTVGTANAPSVVVNNQDVCSFAASAAVQTQILGISLGATYTEDNCLRLKKAQKLYMFGMKVAAVSVMCQDPDVWAAMMSAGTPCPIDGLIGDEAKRAWAVKTDAIPMPEEQHELTAQEKRDKALSIMGTVAAAFMFF